MLLCIAGAVAAGQIPAAAQEQATAQAVAKAIDAASTQITEELPVARVAGAGQDHVAHARMHPVGQGVAHRLAAQHAGNSLRRDWPLVSQAKFTRDDGVREVAFRQEERNDGHVRAAGDAHGLPQGGFFLPEALDDFTEGPLPPQFLGDSVQATGRQGIDV